MKLPTFLPTVLALTILFASCDKHESVTPPLPDLPDPSDICSSMDDIKFREYCYKTFDTDGDWKISPDEAAAVHTTDLREYNQQIYSTKGIAYFPNLTTLHIPRSLESIDLSHNTELRFLDCASSCLTEINLMQNSKLELRASFENCEQLKTVFLPGGICEIGDNTFFNCISLTAINIPPGVRRIGKRAFCNCTSLYQINLNEELEEIDTAAFLSCSGLAYIDFPVSLRFLRCAAFQNCTRLRYADMRSQSGQVREIESDAFSRCFLMKRVILPKNLEVIGEYAFHYTQLTSIWLPENLKRIEAAAFRGCDIKGDIFRLAGSSGVPGLV